MISRELSQSYYTTVESRDLASYSQIESGDNIQLLSHMQFHASSVYLDIPKSKFARLAWGLLHLLPIVMYIVQGSSLESQYRQPSIYSVGSLCYRLVCMMIYHLDKSLNIRNIIHPFMWEVYHSR